MNSLECGKLNKTQHQEATESSFHLFGFNYKPLRNAIILTNSEPSFPTILWSTSPKSSFSTFRLLLNLIWAPKRSQFIWHVKRRMQNSLGRWKVRVPHRVRAPIVPTGLRPRCPSQVGKMTREEAKWQVETRFQGMTLAQMPSCLSLSSVITIVLAFDSVTSHDL